MKSNLLCTSCPFGCRLEVEHDDREIFSVTGNRCKKGLEYAEHEIFDPRRVVTTTVRISGAPIELVPVKTDRSIPKKLCFDIVQAASRICLHAPVNCGDVVIENVCGSGANLVVTRSLGKKSDSTDEKNRSLSYRA